MATPTVAPDLALWLRTVPGRLRRDFLALLICAGSAGTAFRQARELANALTDTVTRSRGLADVLTRALSAHEDHSTGKPSSSTGATNTPVDRGFPPYL